MSLFRVLFLLCLFGCTAYEATIAEMLPLRITRLSVKSQSNAPDLICQVMRKDVRRASQPPSDPVEIPSEDDIQAVLEEIHGSANSDATVPTGMLDLKPSGQTLRVAIWGDSHLAAGFFTQELVRLSGLPAQQVHTSVIPPSLNRGGVRLSLRKLCVSPDWRAEAAYVNASSAANPGPGLVNLVSTKVGAEMAWDVRDSSGEPASRQIRVLFQQAESTIRLGISIDFGTENEVVLEGPVGASVLELVGDAPISVIRLRLLDGQLRLHGLMIDPTVEPTLQLDVFGFPGATVAAWKQANLSYLSTWFSGSPYDLVIMEYGTNEGNVKPFDSTAYKSTLTQAVANLKTVFPNSACLLISPGDRGVLIRRSVKLKRKQSVKGAPASRAAAQARKIGASQSVASGRASNSARDKDNLLRYSRVHDEISRIQFEVASRAGCMAWSAFQAMGGAGSAYIWAREKPALMSSDLTHFTVKGYQRLAQQFANDVGWNSSRLLGSVILPPTKNLSVNKI